MSNDLGHVLFGATLRDGRGVLLLATPKAMAMTMRVKTIDRRESLVHAVRFVAEGRSGTATVTTTGIDQDEQLPTATAAISAVALPPAGDLRFGGMAEMGGKPFGDERVEPARTIITLEAPGAQPTSPQ